MKRFQGQRKRISGSIWLASLKTLAVLFAISLFSGAVWYRHRQHNPSPVEAESQVVVWADGDESGGTIFVIPDDDSSMVPRVAAVSSKSGAVLVPGEWTFIQPDGNISQPLEEPEPAVLISSSKSYALAHSNSGLIRRNAPSSGGRIVLTPEVVQSDLDRSGGRISISDKPELIQFESFINYGNPIDLKKGATTPSDVLISSSKSIAMPIFSTRKPDKTDQPISLQSADPELARILMMSSKSGRIMPVPGEVPETVRLISASPQRKPENRQPSRVLMPSSKMGVFVNAPLVEKVIEPSALPEGLGRGILDWSSADIQLNDIENSGDRLSTGYRFPIDPSILSPPFQPAGERDPHIQIRFGR